DEIVDLAGESPAQEDEERDGDARGDAVDEEEAEVRHFGKTGEGKDQGAEAGEEATHEDGEVAMPGEVTFDLFAAIGVQDFSEVGGDEVIGFDAATADGEDDGVTDEHAEHAGGHHAVEAGYFAVDDLLNAVAVGVDFAGDVSDGGIFLVAAVACHDQGDVFG